MKLPKKVVIFGKAHVVKCAQGLNYDERPVRGLFVPGEDTIYIDASQEEDEQWQTLLHEMFHALVARVSLYQTGIPMELEEIMADTVATMISENFTLKQKKAS